VARNLGSGQVIAQASATYPAKSVAEVNPDLRATPKDAARRM
jgi:hypothetical protein